MAPVNWHIFGRGDDVSQIDSRYLEKSRRTSSDDNMYSRTYADIVLQIMMMTFLLQIVSGFV